MSGFTNHELDMMSRALERAITLLRGTPRENITTSDLAQGIIEAAAAGIRCEETLAQRALAYVGCLSVAVELEKADA
jgi:hypothetical protein